MIFEPYLQRVLRTHHQSSRPRVGVGVLRPNRADAVLPSSGYCETHLNRTAVAFERRLLVMAGCLSGRACALER